MGNVLLRLGVGVIALIGDYGRICAGGHRLGVIPAHGDGSASAGGVGHRAHFHEVDRPLRGGVRVKSCHAVFGSSCVQFGERVGPELLEIGLCVRLGNYPLEVAGHVGFGYFRIVGRHGVVVYAGRELQCKVGACSAVSAHRNRFRDRGIVGVCHKVVVAHVQCHLHALLAVAAAAYVYRQRRLGAFGEITVAGHGSLHVGQPRVVYGLHLGECMAYAEDIQTIGLKRFQHLLGDGDGVGAAAQLPVVGSSGQFHFLAFGVPAAVEVALRSGGGDGEYHPQRLAGLDIGELRCCHSHESSRVPVDGALARPQRPHGCIGVNRLDFLAPADVDGNEGAVAAFHHKATALKLG